MKHSYFDSVSAEELNEVSKSRIAENLKRELKTIQNGEKRRAVPAWFSSKRVRAVAAIALSAAIVTAVAVPVGIYYGGEGDTSVSSGYLVKRSSGSSNTQLSSAMETAYRFETDLYSLNEDIVVTFSYAFAHNFKRHYYLNGNATYDEAYGNFYAVISNGGRIKYECDKYGGFDTSPNMLYFEYGFLKNTIAGHLDSEKGFYVHDVIQFTDKDSFPYEKYGREVQDRGDKRYIEFEHSDSLVIPQELLIGDSGELEFEFVGYIEFINLCLINNNSPACGTFLPSGAYLRYYNGTQDSTHVYYRIEDNYVRFSSEKI